MSLAAPLPAVSDKNRRAPDKQKTSVKTTKKTTGKTTRKTAGKTTRKKTTHNKKETSRDVQRRHEAARKEIRQTEQQIRMNDAEVKRNLAMLGKLQGDIDVSKRKVAVAGAKVNALQSKITGLQTRVAAEEKQLQKLRGEYLKAVKAMRAKRKEKSLLAFIFSSKSFNEAVRRMRYLRQFSEWRDSRAKEITGRVATLKKQTQELAQTKSQHDRQLAVELKARNELQGQYARQDAVVTELKKNGQALKTHLAKKQAEANALNNQVAALIAEETRKAEAERVAREREERIARQKAEAAEKARLKAEEERLAAQQAEEERRAVHKAESERRAETGRKTATERKENEKLVASENSVKAKPPKKKEQDRKKEQPRKQDPKIKKGDSEVSYAEARRRRPKSGKAAGSLPSPVKPEAAKSVAKTGGSFEAMRGSLPRPVSGAFKVTSRFGRQSYPDMPDVSYDNPGIDAEVSAGASAQAVYDGKVSGVYVVPGYATVVLVSHGTYYTVYGHLASVSVKPGDSVRQGQTIGRVASDEDNPSVGSIHFEVRKNREKLNPLSWIR